MSGYSPAPPTIRRPVTTANFDEWCADPRGLTFEEYMEERIPAPGSFLPAPPRSRTAELSYCRPGAFMTLQAGTSYASFTPRPALPPNHLVPC